MLIGKTRLQIITTTIQTKTNINYLETKTKTKTNQFKLTQKQKTKEADFHIFFSKLKDRQNSTNIDSPFNRKNTGKNEDLRLLRDPSFANAGSTSNAECEKNVFLSVFKTFIYHKK